MAQKIIFTFTYLITHALAYIVPSPTPNMTRLTRRDDAPDIPTFTFGPISNYPTFPTPSGEEIQIYPTGIYDRLPEKGIEIAIGPDLRKRVKDIMVTSCKDGSTDECHAALVPVLHKPEIEKHAKRFLPLLFTVSLLVALVAIAIESYHFTNEEPPSHVKLGNVDLNQLEHIGSASKIAYVMTAGAIPTTINLPSPLPTKTASHFAAFETLTADNGQHKAGDVVFHLPKEAADHIFDFLSMHGLKQELENCKKTDKTGGIRRREDIAAACLPVIERYAMGLNKGIADTVQVAKALIPAPGQDLKIPIPNLKVGDIQMAVVIVRKEISVTVDHPLALASIVLALTAVLHVFIYGAQTVLELAIPKAMVLLDEVKEEELECPKELLCPDLDCKAQREFTSISFREAVCPGGKYEGCSCTRVFNPEWRQAPFDAQYQWLQDLIKLWENPPVTLHPKCSSFDWKVAGGKKQQQR
ncbi:hypothetical protein B0J11DRAFT_448343 [Dendryphion nanum]|uniref:Uncharacterized protein n=1 Tax=Dendryphion nanum TaxID=256645 RepID=A0A9P9D0T2_9PLEO|nr:hypothetical protein B0J11DRAFT_448343 [Dendryphion nanum]